MLESGQIKTKKLEAKALKTEYRLGWALVVLAILMTAVIAFWPGPNKGLSTWLQVIVAGAVFIFVIGANRRQIPLRTWIIGAGLCAGLVLFSSVFAGEYMNVLFAPLVVGVGLRKRSQNLIFGLSLAAIGLVIIERVMVAALGWSPKVELSSAQGAIAAIIAVSTIGLTVATFIRSYRKEIELFEQEHQTNVSEMEVAHEIQTSLMAPNEIETGNWSMAARSLPAKDVGGDFYEYIPYLDRGIGGIAIGDVAGKGIPAALQMAVVRTLFRVEARRRIFPAETLLSVNMALQAERSFGMVTLCYAFVDPTTSTLHVANAGHNYPIILNGTPTLEEVKLPGLPLGIDEDAEYEEKVIKIKAGLSIVFYTDGVVEAMNSDGEIYGFERMKASLLLNQKLEPRLLVDKMMSEVAHFTEGAPQSDDITVVVLQHHLSPASIGQPAEPAESEPVEAETVVVGISIANMPGTGKDSRDEEDDGLNWI